jgi:hypothetical protein
MVNAIFHLLKMWDDCKMSVHEKDSKPGFVFDFISFATFTGRAEVAITVSPDWELKNVSDLLHSPENMRLLHLVFGKTEPKRERRIFTLKEIKDK